MNNVNHFICLDFETGGLSPKKNPITQIALKGFSAHDFSEICEYTCYVKPYDNLALEEAALKATGIMYLDIMNGVDISECMKNFVTEVEKVKQMSSRTHKPILIGHNIGFDIGFLLYAAEKTKTDLSKYLDGKIDHKGNFYPSYMDTLLMCRTLWANDTTISKFNLTSCCRKAQLEEFDAHSAMNDVIATKELFLYLLKRMRSFNSEDEQKETRFRDVFQY